jgi:hypothetical protein
MRFGWVLFLSVVFAAHAFVASADEMDDILGGFEDEDPDFAIEEAGEAADEERWWDVSGSFEASASYNYRRHQSRTGTNYKGLQRLRSRLNLALDLDLPDYEYFRDGKVKLEGWGFYDVAYAINGRSHYTEAVLDQYELDAEVGEAWFQGSPNDFLDIKVGRQIVIWGRSESLRVLDILNPLDNREPGRVDIEDLRRPLGMAKVDAFLGDWSLSLIAIPEVRFDRTPVPGSDFYQVSKLAPIPREKKPKNFGDGEYAARLMGIFSGWDVSLHGAWFWNDAPRLDLRLGFPRPLTLVHDRLWMVGSGGNYTFGSWLLKYEVAYTDGLGFAASSGDEARGDILLGIEYYGFTDTTIVLEGVNRHIFDHEPAIRSVSAVRQNMQEFSLRATKNFWNDTLHVTVVGIGFGYDLSFGSVVRLDVSYDIQDALKISGGILLYQNGDYPPLNQIGRNDRLLLQIKYSF